jgi:predicted acylesterase/phospholipase RssA
MFGAYQAGAWKVLAERFRPDLVVGASAGALNAWAIAGECLPDDLIAVWLDPTNAGLAGLHFPLPPWQGFFDAAPLTRRVANYYSRFRPHLPCAITMVEVPALRRAMVCGESITAAHLLASCAVPFGYPPVRIDGKLYVDGGLLDAVPVWAAVELGATKVVVLNALPVMPSLVVRTAVRAFRAVAPRAPRLPDVERIEIRPAGALGTVHEAMNWKEANIRRWIRQGEEDAAAVSLVACGS